MRDSTVKDLDELHKKAKASRLRLEGTWFMNLAYFLGKQWLAWDGRGLYQPRLRKDRITIVDNRIQPCVRTEIAKLTKNRPVFTISPRTADEEDANAAELGEQLMLYLWPHLNLQEASVKALQWSRICCAGFLKAFWDPTIGEGTDVVVGPGGNVLTDGNGKPFRADQVNPVELSQSLGLPPDTVRSKRINQGDIRVEVRSPFQMYPDPLADTFAECEWVIEESIQSQGAVLRRYGKAVEPDAPANPGMIEARMSGSQLTGGSYKGVKVREYWCKPNGEHPNGRRAVWVKDQLLLEDEKPFDPFPYVMLSSIPVPGRLWPTSITEQLRGPQTELNKVKSQIAENRNRVGNPTILASRQAVQDPDKFGESTTMPGGIYYYDDLGSPNTVPTYLVAPPLPQYVVDEVARIEESIQEISGQHEVTSANVPPGVTAASAINLLMEADDTRLGPAVTDYEYQLGKLGQKVLKLAARYYTDARTIRIAGDDGQWQIFDFRGSMLRDNTHVQVQAGSAFPQSRAAKQAAMQDLLTFFVQSGNPPHGRQLAQFLKDWEMGGATRLIDEYTQDEKQSERENVRMAQGGALLRSGLPINEYDNDQAHIDSHQDFQKQQRYEQLTPEIKQIFTAHVQAHKDRVAQQQQAQMQLEMAQQGQPPPGQQAAAGQMDLQGQAQQQGVQAAQAQQQMDIKGAQGDQQAAQSEQQRQHAEEDHRQSLRHAEERHQQQMRQAARTQHTQGGQRG